MNTIMLKINLTLKLHFANDNISIACSKVQMGTRDESITRKITSNFSSLSLSLECNHVEGFKKSGKLETLYGFGG